MQQIARKVWAWILKSIDAQDAFLVVGLFMLSFGLAQVYAPLLLVTPGAALTYLAWPKRPVIVKRQPPQES